MNVPSGFGGEIKETNDCAFCGKDTIYAEDLSERVCTNKKCGIGKNFKKRDYRDRDMDYNVWDVLYQFLFFGGIIALATLWMHDSSDAFFVWLITGIASLLVSVVSGLLITDDMMSYSSSKKGWKVRRKMFWWIAWVKRKK